MVIDELSRENAIHAARKLVQQHEGLRLKPYKDTTGHLTIGFGRNLDSNGLRYKEALFLLQNDLEEAYTILLKYIWFKDLSIDRRAVLVDMMFNLGPTRFAQFKKFMKALQKKDYNQAALEMLNSKWSSQVKTRAARLAEIMRTG